MPASTRDFYYLLFFRCLSLLLAVSFLSRKRFTVSRTGVHSSSSSRARQQRQLKKQHTTVCVSTVPPTLEGYTASHETLENYKTIAVGIQQCAHRSSSSLLLRCFQQRRLRASTIAHTQNPSFRLVIMVSYIPNFIIRRRVAILASHALGNLLITWSESVRITRVTILRTSARQMRRGKIQ